jgi:hypothetical protein
MLKGVKILKLGIMLLYLLLVKNRHYAFVLQANHIEKKFMK